MPVELSRELLRAAKRGDRRAYDRVGRWMTEAVIRFHVRQGRSFEDAQEKGQRALADLVEKFDRLPDEPEAFRRVVLGFAKKAALQDSTKIARYENKRAEARVYPRTPSRRPDSWLVIRRVFEFIKSEVRKLPSPFRSTFGLAMLRDKYSEVAAELKVSEKTVQSRVWRARQMLRSALRRTRVASS